MNIEERFSSNTTRLCWLAFAAHLLPLVALILINVPWITADSGRYIALSESLAQGRGFGLGAEASYEPEGWRLPGYPVIVAVGRFIAFGNNWGIVLIQSALFLASVWFVYQIAVKTFGALTGLAFLMFSAIYPFVAYSVGQISPEITSVFLITLAFFLLSELTTSRVASAAILIGLSAYVRPNLILLNFALASALVLIDRRRNYRKALLMIGVAVIVALPWAARNYMAFGKFTPMPVIKGSGVSLLIATWQSRISTGSMIEYGMRGNFNAEARSNGMADQISDLNRRLGVPENTIFVSPEAYSGNQAKIKADQLFAQTALSNIREYPGAYLKSALKNSMRMWFSANFPGSVPGVINFGLLVEGILVLIFGIAGAFITLREGDDRQRAVSILFVMTFVYFSATLCWLHTEARYTIPARLLLLLFAAQFTNRLIGKLSPFMDIRTSRSRKSNVMNVKSSRGES